MGSGWSLLLTSQEFPCFYYLEFFLVNHLSQTVKSLGCKAVFPFPFLLYHSGWPLMTTSGFSHTSGSYSYRSGLLRLSCLESQSLFFMIEFHLTLLTLFLKVNSRHHVCHSVKAWSDALFFTFHFKYNSLAQRISYSYCMSSNMCWIFYTNGSYFLDVWAQMSIFLVPGVSFLCTFKCA